MNKNNFLQPHLFDGTCRMYAKTELPENPKDQEEYRDHQGNSWIYNAMLMRWALMPSMANGLSTTHYYYPKSDSWTDANGMKVDAPSKVNVGAKSSTKSKSSGSVLGKHAVHPVFIVNRKRI